MRRLICVVVVLAVVVAVWRQRERNAAHDVPRTEAWSVQPKEADAAAGAPAETAAGERGAIASKPLPTVEPLPDAAPSAEARTATVRLPTGDAGAPAWDKQRSAPDHELTADEILRTMQERYAALQSYVDRGRETRTWHELNKVYSDVPFRTFFKRPAFFRFEALGDVDPYRESFWSNASGVYVQTALRVPLRFRSVEAALKNAPVMATYIAPLLMPKAASRPFLQDVARLADDAADNVPCYRVSGVVNRPRWPCEVWIGKSDFLIRRIVAGSRTTYDPSTRFVYGSGSETVQTDFFDVVADINLPDELFTPRVPN